MDNNVRDIAIALNGANTEKLAKIVEAGFKKQTKINKKNAFVILAFCYCIYTLDKTMKKQAAKIKALEQKLETLEEGECGCNE